jgi:two-component system sensor histidine kinase KdpD
MRQAISTGWQAALLGTVIVPFLLAWLLLPLRTDISVTDVAMLQLLWIAWMAYRFGKAWALATTLLSVLLLNWHFVPPFNTLHVYDASNLISFVVMAALGAAISYLSDSLQQQLQKTRASMAQLRGMYRLSRGLATRRTFESCCQYTARFLSRRLACSIQITLSPPTTIDATLVLPIGQPQAMAWLILPYQADASQHPLLQAACSLLAQSLQNLQLQQQREQQQLQMESEQNRTMLLRSLSHDFRTPLATIMGASSMLADSQLPLTDQQKQQQAANIYQQSLLLNQQFEKVLELSKAQLTKATVQLEMLSTADVISGALARRPELTGLGPQQLSLPAAAEVMAVADLLEIALANMLENACKHGQPPLQLELRQQQGLNQLRLTNQLRVTAKRGRDSSSGLGIPIIETIASLHQGRFYWQIDEDNQQVIATLEWPLCPNNPSL